jgi:hypothetical protein
MITSLNIDMLISEFDAHGADSALVDVLLALNQRLDEIEAKMVDGPKAKSVVKAKTDAEWLESLCVDEAYKGIDVKKEFAKMTNWCEVRNKRPTKRRLINWLNNVEGSINVAGVKGEVKAKVMSAFEIEKRMAVIEADMAKLRYEHGFEDAVGFRWLDGMPTAYKKLKADRERLRDMLKQVPV